MIKSTLCSRRCFCLKIHARLAIGVYLKLVRKKLKNRKKNRKKSVLKSADKEGWWWL